MTPTSSRPDSRRGRARARERTGEEGEGRTGHLQPIILGITRPLATESFLSAASFRRRRRCSDAAIEGKIDRLLGLKGHITSGKRSAQQGSSATARSGSALGEGARRVYDAEAVWPLSRRSSRTAGPASTSLAWYRPRSRGLPATATPSLSQRTSNEGGAAGAIGLPLDTSTLCAVRNVTALPHCAHRGRRPRRPGVACDKWPGRHRRRLRPPGPATPLAGLREGSVSFETTSSAGRV